MIGKGKYGIKYVCHKPDSSGDEIYFFDPMNKTHISFGNYQISFFIWNGLLVGIQISHFVYSWSKCFLDICYDLGDYFIAYVKNYETGERGYCYFSRTGHGVVGIPGDSEPFSDGIPISWNFDERVDEFIYPKVFTELFLTVVLSLKKFGIPRRLLIKNIFVPVWEEKRNNLLEIMFNNLYSFPHKSGKFFDKNYAEFTSNKFFDKNCTDEFTSNKFFDKNCKDEFTSNKFFDKNCDEGISQLFFPELIHGSSSRFVKACVSFYDPSSNE